MCGLIIAMMLISDPDVIIADEPTGNLDLENSRQIVSLMQQLSADGLTVVMVTHDMREAFTLATRVVAFERPRDRPEEKLRYGATITRDIAIWPPRKAGEASLFRPDRDGPVSSQGQ